MTSQQPKARAKLVDPTNTAMSIALIPVSTHVRRIMTSFRTGTALPWSATV